MRLLDWLFTKLSSLQVMLDRLAAIQDASRARPLLQVLLKLFRLSVKVKKNQEVLSRPELGAVTVLLDVLQRCLATESDSTQAKVTEQLLDIMETILSNATSQSLESFEAFSRTLGGPEHVKALLSCTQSSAVRQSNGVLVHLARVVAALTYGNQEKMALLCDYFKPVLNFYNFDFEHTPEDEQKLELFCILTQGIERNAIGNTLKDHIIDMGIVKDAFEYITVRYRADLLDALCALIVLSDLPPSYLFFGCRYTLRASSRLCCAQTATNSKNSFLSPH